MKKLFVLFAAVLILAACKKRDLGPKNINNTYITIIGDTTTHSNPTNPTMPEFGTLIDSVSIATSSDTTNGVWVSNASASIRSLGASELPSFPYGASTIGVEFRIEFVLNVSRQITFSNDQSLQVTPITAEQVGISKNMLVTSIDANHAKITMSTIVMRNSNIAPVATRAFVENFYYFVDGVPRAVAINLSTNQINLFKKEVSTSNL
jgi:hypothetical protein